MPPKRSDEIEVPIKIESNDEADGRFFPYTVKTCYSPPRYRNKLRALELTSNDAGPASVTGKNLEQKVNGELRKRGANLVLASQELIPLLYANFNWRPFWLKKRKRIPRDEFRHLAVEARIRPLSSSTGLWITSCCGQ